MKIAAVLTATLVLPACSLAEPAGPVPMEVGKTFELKPGASSKTADGALRIGFEAVTADSRCPMGGQSVWAGDATVKVWIQQGAGPMLTGECHATPGARQTPRVAGHTVQLVRLDPHPVAGTPIAAADYTATFALGRDAGTDAAER